MRNSRVFGGDSGKHQEECGQEDKARKECCRVHYRWVIIVSKWSYIQLRTLGESAGHTSLRVVSSKGRRIRNAPTDNDVPIPLAAL